MLFFSVSKSFLDFRFYICKKNMTTICSVESDAGCPAICRATNRDERERTILNVFAIYQSMLHCIAMRQNAKAIIHVFPFEYTSILLLLLLMWISLVKYCVCFIPSKIYLWKIFLIRAANESFGCCQCAPFSKRPEYLHLKRGRNISQTACTPNCSVMKKSRISPFLKRPQ